MLFLHEVETRFEERQYNEVIDDETFISNRFKLKCVFLYSTAGQKKISFFKSNKNNSKIRSQEVSNYDRFVVLGVHGTQHVLLAFTNNSEESSRLLNFKTLKPGQPVWILCPKVIGYLKGTQNPLIKTGDPLVPCARSNLFSLPPSDVNISNYVFFDFLATNLRVTQAVPLDNVCRGKLCDSQCKPTGCPCLVAETKKHWVLSVTFTCDEFSEGLEEEEVTITPMELTKALIHSSKKSHQLVNEERDTYEMEDAVCRLCASINAQQKFRVIGWFQPAQTEEGSVASGHFAYHVCSLIPHGDLSAHQQALMYGAPVTLLNAANVNVGCANPSTSAVVIAPAGPSSSIY